MTKEALKLALEALQVATTPLTKDRQEVLRAITAIKEALAQPEQELVGWRVTYSKVIKALDAIVTVHTPDNLFDLDAIPRDPVMGLVQQIRVAIDGYEPPKRTWVELTDDEIKSCWNWETDCQEWAIEFARAILRKAQNK